MKLHIINNLLNEFDTARSTNDIDKLVTDLEQVYAKTYSIINALKENDEFKSILEFIALEVNYTIESELEKLNTNENTKLSEVRNG